MIRRTMNPRPNWKEVAEEHGFFFHHVDGELYWDESACYAFTMQEIEEGLEDPAQELNDMCLDLVAEVAANEELLEKLAIPPLFWDMIRDSWVRNEPSLYGRFDFAYDGKGPAKLYEYNADTPTALYEAAYFQWIWLEDCLKSGRLPKGCDQFNSIQEQLVETLASFEVPGLMHFASMKDTEEDRATVEYLRDCAVQAGLKTKQIYMEDIETDAKGLLMDPEKLPIHWLFKLYPWEYIWEDEIAPAIPFCDTTFVEPAWKMILSNKGILPLLWERHQGHPNLLPAWFHKLSQKPLTRDFVVKPLLSREGANIQVYHNYRQSLVTEGEYGKEGHIAQELCPPPFSDGNGPVCGVWIVNGKSCGLGVREDKGPITTNLSRFVPHIILPE